ncbi:hypothetical protein [Halobacillus litoralis]|uniref:hypothetical protein n=1 Tax=Halobacillus litoralis TaxID=45668 RepID=UPI002492CF6E|nr:hypothetical protein [Halobacillus litoralis]
MKKENQMFWVLTFIGTANIIAALALFFSIQDPMISVMLIASGILLVIGGYADRNHRRKHKKKP